MGEAVVEKLPVEVALQRIRGKRKKGRGREGRERKDERERKLQRKKGGGEGKGIAWNYTRRGRGRKEGEKKTERKNELMASLGPERLLGDTELVYYILRIECSWKYVQNPWSKIQSSCCSLTNSPLYYRTTADSDTY